MTPEEFKKLYQCDFSLSDREIKLLQRVEKYFSDTDDVDFRVSQNEAKALKAWCDDNGYSKGDLNRAKQVVNKYAG